jgi:hypothetical protein
MTHEERAAAERAAQDAAIAARTPLKRLAATSPLDQVPCTGDVSPLDIPPRKGTYGAGGYGAGSNG